MVPIYLCLLPLIIILLIILIVLSFIYYVSGSTKNLFTSQNLQDTLSSVANIAPMVKLATRGGNINNLSNNKYKINFPKYITIKSLLKNDFYVLPINDIEEKNPKLEIEFKEEKNNNYCFDYSIIYLECNGIKLLESN